MRVQMQLVSTKQPHCQEKTSFGLTCDQGVFWRCTCESTCAPGVLNASQSHFTLMLTAVF